jgi:hypothetical protein
MVNVSKKLASSRVDLIRLAGTKGLKSVVNFQCVNNILIFSRGAQPADELWAILASEYVRDENSAQSAGSASPCLGVGTTIV